MDLYGNNLNTIETEQLCASIINSDIKVNAAFELNQITSVPIRTVSNSRQHKYFALRQVAMGE